MEVLFRENYDLYFVCTDDEMRDIRKKYKNHQNRVEYNGTMYDNHVQFFDNSEISCRPSCLHLDGFISKGGRTFDAKGIKVGYKTVSGYDWRYYFKKEDIVTNEIYKTEEWFA